MMRISSYQDYENTTLDAVEKYNSENYKEALEDFLAMAQYHPENLKVHELLCYTYSKLKDTKKAEEEYQIYVNLAKAQGKAILQLRTFEDLVKEAGDISEVKKEFEKVLEDKSEFDLSNASACAMKYTHLLMGEGRYQEAALAMNLFKEKVLSLRKAAKN